MPPKSKSLISTAREVASAKSHQSDDFKVAEFRIAGTPNLILKVRPSGQRAWTYLVRRPKTGRWSKIQLGTWPAVSLADARAEAVRLKRMVLDGIDPLDQRETARGTITVKDLSARYVAHAKLHKRERSWSEEERILRHDILPALGTAFANQVSKRDVVDLLDGIVARGSPVMANHVLAVIRQLLNYAVAEGS